MRKQQKQFIGILIVLVIAVGALIGVNYYNEHVEEQEAKEAEESAITVSTPSSDEITAFSYVVDGNTLSFTKGEDDTWTYDADSSIDIDEDAIATMLATAEDLTANKEITDPEDLAEYGLEEPSNVITLHTADGTTTLSIGNENEVTSNIYLMSSLSDSVYAVDAGIETGFTSTVEDLTAAQEEETEE